MILLLLLWDIKSLAHSACACRLPDIVLLMLLLDGLAAAVTTHEFPSALLLRAVPNLLFIVNPPPMTNSSLLHLAVLFTIPTILTILPPTLRITRFFSIGPGACLARVPGGPIGPGSPWNPGNPCLPGGP